MKINREEFTKALAAVRPGLAKKDIIEQATHFIFTGNEVTTYNDYICISYPLKTDFRCTVDADKLYKVLAGMEAKQIDVEVKKDEFLISTKKTKSGLASFKEGKILEYIVGLGLKEKDKKWKPLPSNFIEGMYLCMFSASTDMTHGALTCVYLKGENIFASDDLRISWFTMDGTVDKKMFIPVQSAVELVKFPVVEYAVSTIEGVTSWIHFRTKDHVMFSTRTMAGEYPSVEEHFEIEGKKLTLPKELKGAVKYVSVLADGVLGGRSRWM
jgi:DNA polymerase III sliding clamp (beta) subunit (PCNA family)